MAVQQNTDEIYHILEDEICFLKILPGEALSENQLCKRFGISRTPIRSVLQRLEQNRFVQIIPCKGTIVTTIDPGVVDQFIFQRVAVEGMVFRDFAQSCSTTGSARPARNISGICSPSRRRITPALSGWTWCAPKMCPACSASTARCCASCGRKIWTPSSR